MLNYLSSFFRRGDKNKEESPTKDTVSGVNDAKEKQEKAKSEKKSR